MSGITGGEMNEARLRTMMGGLAGRGSERSWRYEHAGAGIGMSYTTADPQGATVWDDGSRAGVAHGVVTNLDELGLTYDEVFDRLLEAPVAAAREMEGEFLVAAYDADRDAHVVVNDKLGGRPCYYTTDGGFRYSTSVDVLLTGVDNPTLDHQSVSDLLLIGYMWGDGTLVEEVRSLRPATVLEVTNGAVTTTRYWKPDYEVEATGERYFAELADRYRQAARRFAGTMPSGAGIWLSGGLDSRTTAAALLEQMPEVGGDALHAFGYDANPPTDDNPQIARDVADTLGIDYTQVDLSAETFAEDFERVIEATDGLVPWDIAANLSATYRIAGDVPVIMEGAQGGLIGDHLLRYNLDDSYSVVESQLHSEGSADLEIVERLLTPSVDPLASFKREARRTSESTHRGKVVDIHFQNYYARSGLTSNNIMRDCTGSRSIQVDGDYLEWCAKIPTYYRKGTFPFSHHVFASDAGGVPYGTSIAKLQLCRRICPDLSEITYERTKVKPSLPYHLHVAGFVGNVLVNRFRSKPTYGTGQLPDFWIRDTDSYVHRRVRELVDDAADRELFDADAVRSIYEAHMEGANNAALLARITTLEYWIQAHLD